MTKAFFNSKEILAVFTDRFGGVSKEPFDSFNFGFHVGDDEDDVLENYQILRERFSIGEIAYMEQVHSDTVKIVDESNEIKETDAIITNKPRLTLVVMVADCIPVLFYDPVNKVIAVAHVGRVGVFKNIIEKTILKMQEKFNSDVENILVSVGPSIKSCCYEVGEDIISATKEKFGKQYIKNKKFLDLPDITLGQLLKSGVIKNNIEIINKCTACNEDYFSYRRNKKTGRCVGVIMIK